MAHDHHFVAHGRDVGAAGGARTHDHRQLGDALGRHLRLVVEDAAKVVPIRKNLGLQRQERAARVHQIDAGQAVFQGDLLGPQVFLDGDRIVGAAFDRGVVGHDHHLLAVDTADAGNYPGPGVVAVVHPPGGQRTEFQKGRPRVQQSTHPVPHQHLASAAVKLGGVGVSPFPHRS